jgi:hypothetical protein
MGMQQARQQDEDDETDWVQAHAALTRLARERATADAEEGRWLLCAQRTAAHQHLGFGSFVQYIEQLFGYSRRNTQEKLRVAEALEQLPAIAGELERGAVGWCAVRELTRVASAETEHAWLDAARGKTVRQLEELVAHHSPGDDPNTPPGSLPRPRVLRFAVAPETFALFREAMQALRRSAGERWDDDAVLLSMARQVLGGPGDDGRSSYQVSLSVCATCGSGEQVAAGQVVPVSEAVVAMAACDAQQLGQLLPGGTDSTHPDASPPGASDPITDGPPPHDGTVHDGTVHDGAFPDIDVPDHAHVCAPAVDTAHTPRAKQTIPPALRRAVLLRDQRRCRVPGCTHATFVDVHHITPRSEGGPNLAENLLTLCSAHHRATHRGQLSIAINAAGTAPTFRHADGMRYGGPILPRVIDTHGKVFAGLRHLGFREGQVRAVLGELLADEALRLGTPERLLREALCRIR